MKVALAAAVAALLAAVPAAGVPIREQVVRAAGVNAEPSMRPWRFSGANPDGWWCRPPACNGVASGTVSVDRELRLSADLGVASLRLEFPWALMEPARGKYDWRRSDYILRRAARLRVNVQPVIVYSPRWAAPSSVKPPRAAEFGRFVRAFASRYRTFLRHYELWNEPDLQRYWAGTQAEYVANILVPGFQAVRAKDPTAKVILGAPSFANRDWLEGIYRLGGGRAFDIAAYHDYSGDHSILDHARIVQDVLRAHGQAAKPIWLGEFGLQESGLDDVRHQALLRMILTTPAPIAMAQWYNLRDDHAMTCCPPHPVVSETYGLLTSRYVRKGSYSVLKGLLSRRAAASRQTRGRDAPLSEASSVAESP